MMLLEMATTDDGERIAVGGWTRRELFHRARVGADLLRGAGARELVYLGGGSAFPAALFAAAWAGIPFVPLNYRLGTDQLTGLLDRHPGAAVLADRGCAAVARTWGTDEWITRTAGDAAGEAWRWDPEPATPAVVLYTSGTSARPKAALLRHRHLLSYLLGSVEFAAAGADEAVLVSVPPYHVAGVSNLLSNIYAGRRIVYLEAFTPQAWLATVRSQRVTHALVVPTMLARVVEHLDDVGAVADVPTLRSLAYGGAVMPRPVLEHGMRMFPGTGFVNAYGLTETSSTIAVLGPEDHRAALAGDPVANRRLGSVGRLLPGVEVQVRSADGTVLPAGTTGLVFVRGEQVSGEYGELGNTLDADRWFATRDRGRIDEDGYLFVEGRADDTIIRGGENIAPEEIEDVLLRHDGVAEAAVVGVPDEEWGQDIVAVVVPRAGATVSETELRDWAMGRLRTSKSPARVIFRNELPQTPTGKLLRRQVLADLLERADNQLEVS
ncbi:fatty acid--CoA ligase family protein [Actinophytocola sp.]|uniref:class I adenylate-forming enzyme family protein n=1 Tax=Actinophytocola sp. TaxID=1872138 RepID=UPI002ED80867